jgi:hypothetical protein
VRIYRETLPSIHFNPPEFYFSQLKNRKAIKSIRKQAEEKLQNVYTVIYDKDIFTAIQQFLNQGGTLDNVAKAKNQEIIADIIVRHKTLIYRCEKIIEKYMDKNRKNWKKKNIFDDKKIITALYKSGFMRTAIENSLHEVGTPSLLLFLIESDDVDNFMSAWLSVIPMTDDPPSLKDFICSYADENNFSKEQKQKPLQYEEYVQSKKNTFEGTFQEYVKREQEYEEKKKRDSAKAPEYARKKRRIRYYCDRRPPFYGRELETALSGMKVIIGNTHHNDIVSLSGSDFFKKRRQNITVPNIHTDPNSNSIHLFDNTIPDMTEMVGKYPFFKRKKNGRSIIVGSKGVIIYDYSTKFFSYENMGIV